MGIEHFYLIVDDNIKYNNINELYDILIKNNELNKYVTFLFNTTGISVIHPDMSDQLIHLIDSEWILILPPNAFLILEDYSIDKLVNKVNNTAD